MPPKSPNLPRHNEHAGARHPGDQALWTMTAESGNIFVPGDSGVDEQQEFGRRRGRFGSRLTEELSKLRRENEALQRENQQLRAQTATFGAPDGSVRTRPARAYSSPTKARWTITYQVRLGLWMLSAAPGLKIEAWLSQ